MFNENKEVSKKFLVKLNNTRTRNVYEVIKVTVLALQFESKIKITII